MKRPESLYGTVGGCLIALLLLAGTAMAEQTVRIGIYNNPPKIFLNEDGRPAGLFPELADEIARREGWQLEWVECGWARCLEMLEQGRLDLMPDVAFSAARAQRFGFHQVAVVQSWSQLYGRPDRRITELAQLEGSRLSIMDGSIQLEFFESLRTESGIALELKPTTELIDTLQAVATGRADFAIVNQFFGQHHAYRHGLVEMPLTTNQVSLLFAAPNDDSPLLGQIDFHLARWKQERDSPYYRALLNALAPATDPIWPRWLSLLLGAGLLVVLVLAGLLTWMRHRIEQTTGRLRESGARLNRLLDSASVVLYSLDYPSMRVNWVTPNFERLTGYDCEDAFGPDWWRTVLHPDDVARVERENQLLEPDRPHSMEYRVLHKQGRWLFVRDEKRLIDDEQDPGRQVVMGSWSDVTEARRQSEQLDYLAFHDRLTSLPNRARLNWLIDQLLIEAEGSRRRGVVILIDLDRFKALNDALGSETGDSVLRLMAARLAQWIGPDDILARFGNDEFCIASLALAENVDSSLSRLFERINQPIPLSDRELTITASIGAALFPDDAETPEELLREAAKALEVARGQGGNAAQQFDPELDRREFHRVFLESDLRQAIELEQLRLHYQPQVDLGNGERIGFEALVRWQHPELGLLPPARFIPLAEQTGLITEIDRWVLHQVCRQIRAWQRAGHDPGRIAVNLSVRELHDRGLVDDLQRCMADSGVEAKSLMLEVTESRLMQNIERSADVLRALRGLGVGISIDDFGHGYSNLSYLARLDASQIKLDRSLIVDLERSPRAQTLARGVIGLFDEMDVEIVAEGIETEGQAGFLRGAGCQIGQGWRFGRPADPEAIDWPEPTAE
ncbi:MAG: EAL domain-containing protein [Wenzhouxiangellaceae bacterium]|nr:EAL domain-containing protein [Wenzhouxiangellaceae bacterium]